jgi:hypothetical protein
MLAAFAFASVCWSAIMAAIFRTGYRAGFAAGFKHARDTFQRIIDACNARDIVADIAPELFETDGDTNTDGAQW